MRLFLKSLMNAILRYLERLGEKHRLSFLEHPRSIRGFGISGYLGTPKRKQASANLAHALNPHCSGSAQFEVDLTEAMYQAVIQLQGEVRVGSAT